MWSMTDCKMKINENMIAVQHDSRTGNIESGLIICFLCSRSFKLNIIRKKNAKKDFAHYVTLSNYRQHILKIHTSRQNVKISKD